MNFNLFFCNSFSDFSTFANSTRFSRSEEHSQSKNAHFDGSSQPTSQIKLVVSRHKFDNLNVHLEPLKSQRFLQMPIGLFASEENRSQIMIRNLQARNNELQGMCEEQSNKTLEQHEIFSDSANRTHHPFVQTLIKQLLENAKGSKRQYSEELKDISLYIFILTSGVKLFVRE